MEQIGFKAWSEENKLQTVKAEHFVIHAMLRVNQLVVLSRHRAAIRHGWCDFVFQHSHLESSLGCVHTKTSKHASPHNSGARTIERKRSRILCANRDPHKGRKCKHEFLVGREGWAWVYVSSHSKHRHRRFISKSIKWQRTHPCISWHGGGRTVSPLTCLKDKKEEKK